MSVQITPAPTNEIASGRKISDLATFSPLARSDSTATASPNAVDRIVTTMTHHRLLTIEPRNVPSTRQAAKKKAMSRTMTEPGVASKGRRTTRPLTRPMTRPMTVATAAIQNSRLPKMLPQSQFSAVKKAGLVMTVR